LGAEKRARSLAVLVGALGYFVDIYDIVLFAVLRRPSLCALGVPESRVLDVGVGLFNWQMGGLLVGGVVFGMLGDRKGRLSVLMASILTYSVANLLNAAVTSLWQYALLRFLAGFGLAGELGAAITLVAESLPAESRGYGTLLVAGLGLLGASVAGFVGSMTSWRVAYLIGGVLGLLLLGLRVRLLESGLYRKMERSTARLGDWRLILFSPRRLATYLECIAIGLPIWFCVGVLITFGPEIAQSLSIGGITAGKLIAYHYIGAALGDLSCGLVSQWTRSRRLAVLIYLLASGGLLFPYLFGPYFFGNGFSTSGFYALSFWLGVATGYWAIFVTMAAELFGTNLRATVTTSVPNFVRGAVMPITLLFKWLIPALSIQGAAMMVGCLCLALAFFSLGKLRESFAADLDFVET